VRIKRCIVLPHVDERGPQHFKASLLGLCVPHLFSKAAAEHKSAESRVPDMEYVRYFGA